LRSSSVTFDGFCTGFSKAVSDASAQHATYLFIFFARCAVWI
jgi:hypothetical protein